MLLMFTSVISGIKRYHPVENNVATFARLFFFGQMVFMEGINGGYKIRNQSAIHFITFAVVDWVDVFTRKKYRNIVVDSLRYCQQHKGLRLHCWCIMSNHLHLIVSAANNNLSDVLRDFKTYTSKQIVSSIINNSTESRREWMVEIFGKYGQLNSRNTNYQFWRQDNQPKELYSAEFVAQKINYIHNNPVEAGIVDKPENYIYSSARDYQRYEKCGLLDVVFI
jgi:REP element-mobilizing transposase RayT